MDLIIMRRRLLEPDVTRRGNIEVAGNHEWTRFEPYRPTSSPQHSALEAGDIPSSTETSARRRPRESNPPPDENMEESPRGLSAITTTASHKFVRTLPELLVTSPHTSVGVRWAVVVESEYRTRAVGWIEPHELGLRELTASSIPSLAESPVVPICLIQMRWPGVAEGIQRRLKHIHNQ